MVLQVLSNFAYQIVEQSWIMATILLKYFLLVIGAKIALKQNFELEHIFDELLEYSGEIVALIVILGFVNVFAGLEVNPLFNTFSQVTAFLYFAFLFWMY
jgi:hypothetical protein